MFKVHFHLKDVDYELVAKSLDLSHPYFVSIRELALDYDEGIVVNPHLENTRQRFKGATTLMIPFQNCYLIEEVPQKTKTSPHVVNVVSMATSESEPLGFNPGNDRESP